MRCKACRGFITAKHLRGEENQSYHKHCPSRGKDHITICGLCGREKLGTDCAQCDDLGYPAMYECKMVDLFKENVKLKKEIKCLDLDNKLLLIQIEQNCY